MRNKAINLDGATKDELRSLCKAQGVKGYSKLNNDGMRAALRALTETDSTYETTGSKEVHSNGDESAAVTTPAKPGREERNGVREPGKGVCRDVWDALDQMRAGGMEATSKELRDLATARTWNQNNATIELGRWRKFHGLTRPVKVAADKPKAQSKAAPVAVRVDGTADQPAA